MAPVCSMSPPESHVGGRRALVQEGDLIGLDVAGRRLDLLVEAEVLKQRRSGWTPPPQRHSRGHTSLFREHVRRADEGCDFDFLDYWEPTPEPEIPRMSLNVRYLGRPNEQEQKHTSVKTVVSRHSIPQLVSLLRSV